MFSATKIKMKSDMLYNRKPFKNITPHIGGHEGKILIYNRFYVSNVSIIYKRL
jgi:hypothetical protein